MIDLTKWYVLISHSDAGGTMRHEMITLLLVASALFLGYFTGRRCRRLEDRQEAWERGWDASEMVHSSIEENHNHGLEMLAEAVMGSHPIRREEMN